MSTEFPSHTGLGGSGWGVGSKTAIRAVRRVEGRHIVRLGVVRSRAGPASVILEGTELRKGRSAARVSVLGAVVIAAVRGRGHRQGGGLLRLVQAVVVSGGHLVGVHISAEVLKNAGHLEICAKLQTCPECGWALCRVEGKKHPSVGKEESPFHGGLWLSATVRGSSALMRRRVQVGLTNDERGTTLTASHASALLFFFFLLLFLNSQNCVKHSAPTLLLFPWFAKVFTPKCWTILKNNRIAFFFLHRSILRLYFCHFWILSAPLWPLCHSKAASVFNLFFFFWLPLLLALVPN